MSKTYGQILFEQNLPSGVQVDGPATKKTLNKAMAAYAKQDPRGYVDVIQRVKMFGDEVATYEGISVGLDDIVPDRKRRDPIMQDALKRIRAAKTDEERRKIIQETEGKIHDITGLHPSDMTLMAKSGGRGSINQLMKTVASPVAATDATGAVVPWLITKSYSEGLKPSEVWVAGAEARRNAIASTGSVVEPGAVAKVVVSNMEDLVVTSDDCKTTNGIRKSVKDPNIVDRYLVTAAGGTPAGTLITSAVVSDLIKKRVEEVTVRSPMTCEVVGSVCQKCMGLNEWGKPYAVGTNVGVRSAQAMTEPLTQFSLNAKHGVRLSGDGKGKLTGLTGFRVLTEVPKSFLDKATLAKHDGSVTRVVEAPQGGHFIYVGETQHYSNPGLKPRVMAGQIVEKGDALTEGVAMPNELVASKGMGAGRSYLSDQLNDLYERQGVQIDHRHTELLARKAINYVEIDKDPTNTFLEGDVVRFDKVQGEMRKRGKDTPLKEAAGKTLAAPALHFSEGTRITPSVVQALTRAGVTSVRAVDKGLEFTPVMKSMIQTPLLSDDWMSRLSHRYLKKTLLDGAGIGMVSDMASTAPIPAYVGSMNFGQGEGGKYAAVGGGFIRKMLLGSGTTATSKVKPRVLGTAKYTTGGVDNDAVFGTKVRKQLGEDTFDRLNIFDDAGVLTDSGREKLDALRSIAPGTFTNRKVKWEDSKVQDALHSAGIGVNDLSKADYERYLANRGGDVRRALVGAKNLAFGDAPLTVLKQRAQQGGIFGRGGLIRGDLSIDPDLERAYRAFKANPNLHTGGGLVARGGMDAFGKTMSYGMPAYGVYEAATQPLPEGQSRGEQIATPIGDTLGWALSGPLGLAGGTMVADVFRTGAGELGKRLDPSYVPPQAPLKHTAQQVGRRYVENIPKTFTSHPMMSYYTAADAAQERARQLYEAKRARRDQLVEDGGVAHNTVVQAEPSAYTAGSNPYNPRG